MSQMIAQPFLEMGRLLAEIAAERIMAKKLAAKGAHRFAKFHWSIVQRDRAKLRALIEQARREINKRAA